MGGWGCPHEINGECMRVRGFACNPGMKGCILLGRFRFSNEEKNRPTSAPRPTPHSRETRQPADRRQPGATKPPSR